MLPTKPTCTCTVSLPGAKTAEVARQLRRATCKCAVSDAHDSTEAPIKVDVHDLPPDHSWPFVAGAIFALAIVTGSQALYTAKLWKSTRQLAQNGEASARRQLRAYIAVSDIAYEPPSRGQAPQVTLTIKNYGCTPAYKLAVAIDTQIASTEQQLSVATSTSRTLGQLPPSVDFAITRSATVAPGVAPRENNTEPAQSVFVHGCIEYVDTFGIPHFVRFRLQGGADGSFFACREGNETDDVLLARTAPVQPRIAA